MSTSTIKVVIEFDDTTDCPSGTAALPGGEPRAFHGWLGLAATLDALAHTAELRPSHAEGEPT